MLPQLFARRYLFSSQSRSVVNLISGLSVAAVAMPVAAMIILLSVFNGFESLVKSMYSAFDADLTVSPRQGQTFAQRDLDTAALARIPGVGALSFTLEQSALLEHGGRQATATIRGVDDAYGAVFQLGDAVSAGEWRVRLGDLERLVVGQSMAWMLGIRSLADADVTLYAVRRGSFSSLLPLENYTRRTEPVGGVYTLDLETERTYVLASLRLAQELFGYAGRASALVVRLAPGADAAAVRKAVAEAAGDGFRVRTRDELRDMTAAQALKHPTWNMGAKITIDSSTLMNKGLEVIEAHHLFDMSYDRIKVVVQPQSAIHSMVEYSDGSVKAHLGTTDMRIPIQFALSYPDRWDAPVEPLDFTQLGKLEFYPVDEDTFRCFKLAKYAGDTGGTLPCVMNAANEVAVAAFLRDACGYLDIDGCVGAIMEAHEAGQGGGLQKVESLDQLADIDAWARGASAAWLAAKAK